MRLPAHLRRSRHGVFYVRRLVADGSSATPRTHEVCVSLRTCDPRKAAHMSRVLSAWIVATKNADLSAGIGGVTSGGSMSIDEIRQQTRGWVTAITRGNTQVRIEVDAHDPIDHARGVELVERALGAGTVERVLDTTTAPVVPVATPLEPVLRSIEHSLELNRALRTPKTSVEYRRILVRFAGWLGEHQIVALAQVTTAHISAYREYLITQCKLTPKSVNKQLTAIGTAFRDAQRAGQFPASSRLPTEGHQFKKRAVAKSVRSWLPLSNDDIATVFDPAVYASMRKPHQFWVPFILLHHGLRVGEASQLHTVDVRQVNGLWTLRVTDEHPGATVKNEASKRTVPLHPALVQLGLPEYLDDLRALLGGDGMLFPYLRADSLNGYGDVPAESINAFLGMRLADARKRSHSFRHTINARLKDGSVGEEVRCQFLGHEHDTVNSTVYGPRLALATLAALVFPALTFPLDYVALRYRPHQFDAAIGAELRRRQRDLHRKEVSRQRAATSAADERAE